MNYRYIVFCNICYHHHYLLAGCDVNCPLEDFLNITKPYIPVDWNKECGLPPSGSSKAVLTICKCRKNKIYNVNIGSGSHKLHAWISSDPTKRTTTSHLKSLKEGKTTCECRNNKGRFNSRLSDFSSNIDSQISVHRKFKKNRSIDI